MSAATSRSDLPGPEQGATGDADLQRAAGAARVVLRRGPAGPALAVLEQKSPCRALLPRVEGRSAAEVVFVNTAGGVAGGDRLAWGFEASGAITARATSQAAEKLYRALDRPALIETRLSASDGALLEWLPQETIAFDGARLARATTLELSGGARATALEWLLLGRAGHGETLCRGALRDVWRVRRDGRLLWADNLRLEGPVAALAARRALLGGAGAVATLIHVAESGLEPLVEALRERLYGFAGVTAGVGALPGLLLCRLLAREAAALRAAVVEALAVLRGLVPGAGPGLPRVWSS
ncbi:urease accessory protein [Tistlia consotensis]|uniref:Urease accessory protein UreD n=1 Tax=Tistlia consotensis USBA 355 TaxID=560819 RepID=A0A1Y6BBJ0_9PROT|nr:urease accessory protein UreD [Tistlia consotensis]SMF02604.1 urease accessory protein [Tistlia consotensis USBA 355]SNR52925.1 urease accessory protein [Tistlia consotensis]